MSDKTTRLLDAERALHRLEIQIEQHRFHLEELVGQPHEAATARTILEKNERKLEWQRRYCELLRNADAAEELFANGGSSRVA